MFSPHGVARRSRSPKRPSTVAAPNTSSPNFVLSLTEKTPPVPRGQAGAPNVNGCR
jgi:hypothetical protein